MDYFGHGTHIAGIIAAKNQNQKGIKGINPYAKLLNVCFLNSQGQGNQLDAAAAIYFSIASKARVINCSWGYSSSSQTLQEAFRKAVSEGVIIVAAAGNSNSSQIEYPAGYDGVVAVSAIENNNQRASFSSYGNHISFTEYGVAIYSTLPKGQYGYKSGTSQSAAVMSGLISRLLAHRPGIDRTEVLEILKASVEDLGTTGRDSYAGFGVPNIQKLFDTLSIHPNEDEQIFAQKETTAANLKNLGNSLSLSEVFNFPNPVGSSGTKFGFIPNIGPVDVTVRIYSGEGSLLRTLESRNLQADYQTIDWDGTDDSSRPLNNGIYFYLLDAAMSGQRVMKKGKLAILR